MTYTYSTYEAKARFSELLQRVRDGHRVLISYRGRVVAELRALEEDLEPEAVIKELESAGVLVPNAHHSMRLAPLGKRRGALARFLASRE